MPWQELKSIPREREVGLAATAWPRVVKREKMDGRTEGRTDSVSYTQLDLGELLKVMQDLAVCCNRNILESDFYCKHSESRHIHTRNLDLVSF